LQLRPGEAFVPIVHSLELASIYGNARRREKTHVPAEFDKARAHPAKLSKAKTGE
jgi:hypothetical protein